MYFRIHKFRSFLELGGVTNFSILRLSSWRSRIAEFADWINTIYVIVYSIQLIVGSPMVQWLIMIVFEIFVTKNRVSEFRLDSSSKIEHHG